jgi:ATP-dependent Clp protease ATP-binding subunit ClpA
MFERYTESARRALFFARYETSLTGSLSIESEHMLLGLLREPGPIGRRLLASAGVSSEQLRQEVESRIAFREKVATSVEIPFSEETRHILTYTALEADNLGHSHIGPEHILLALLRVPESIAGAILTGHGLRLQTAREDVVAILAEGPQSSSRRAADADAPAVAPDQASPVLEPERPRVDTEEIVAAIDRIHRLVEQIRMTLPTPHESTDRLHLLHVELASLRSRFSR